MVWTDELASFWVTSVLDADPTPLCPSCPACAYVGFDSDSDGVYGFLPFNLLFHRFLTYSYPQAAVLSS